MGATHRETSDLLRDAALKIERGERSATIAFSLLAYSSELVGSPIASLAGLSVLLDNAAAALKPGLN